MARPTLDELQQTFNSYVITDTSIDELSYTYKVLQQVQEQFKQTESEFKLIAKFRESLVKHIRAVRKAPTPEVIYEPTLEI